MLKLWLKRSWMLTSHLGTMPFPEPYSWRCWMSQSPAQVSASTWQIGAAQNLLADLEKGRV